MRKPGCKQVEYPCVIYMTTANEPLQGTYERPANPNKQQHMYWVVDTFVQVNSDFDFDYYPTQWDIDKLHVLADEDDNFRNIRLVPTKLFLNNTFSNKEIENNSSTPQRGTESGESVSQVAPEPT